MRGIWAVVIVGVATAGPAFGAVLFQDDFEAYSVGSDPGVPPIGQAWVLDRQQYADNLRISDMGPSHSLACERYSVQNQSPNAQAHLTAQGTADAAGHVVTISMDLNKQFGDSAATLAALAAYNGDARLANIYLKDDGSIVYYDTAVHATGLTYTTSAWHVFELEFDFSARTFSIRMDGSATEGSTGIAMVAGESTMTHLAIAAGSGGTLYVDNLLIVPEPATAFFWSLGIGAALLRRRRV